MKVKLLRKIRKKFTSPVVDRLGRRIIFSKDFKHSYELSGYMTWIKFLNIYNRYIGIDDDLAKYYEQKFNARERRKKYNELIIKNK